MTSTTRTPAPKRKLVIAGSALVLAGIGGVVASGAWFTDQTEATNNTLSAATVQLAEIDSTQTAALSVGNIIPIADANAAAQAPTGSLKISNVGTAPFRWSAELEVAGTSNALVNAARIDISYNNGTTWTGPQDLADVVNVPQVAPDTLTTASENSSQTLLYRVWLPQDADNTLQGATANFDLQVRAIQTDAPNTTFTDDGAFTPLHTPSN